MREEFKSHLENFHLSPKTLRLASFETIKSLKNYGLNNPHQQHLVNFFHNIGWPDPFPAPLRVAAKHTEPKPAKEDLQLYLEQAKEYNRSLLTEHFMREAADVVPAVHLVRLRATDRLLRHEVHVKNKLAYKLRSAFKAEDQAAAESQKGDKSTKKKGAKRKSKPSPS